MKVHELIKQLENEDPNALVIVDGYEAGYDTFSEISQKTIAEAVEPEPYEGSYNDGDQFNAVYLPRNSFQLFV